MTDAPSDDDQRPPDYLLRVKDRDTGNSHTCGVAWRRSDGSIGIKLKPGTRIDWLDPVVMSLFENTKRNDR